VLGIEGGSPLKISLEGRYNSSPAWSSKNQIAYSSLSAGTFDIIVTDPEGQRQVRVAGGNGNCEDPSWAPNGRYLVYSSNREGRYKIFLQSPGAQAAKRLFNLEGDQTMPFWFK
jgi:TolB protein